MFGLLLLALTNATTTTNELAVKRAQDSINMVETVLYNPVIPAADPVAARMFLPCRASRMTIIKVRRILSETEIERYGMPNWENIGHKSLARWCCRKYSSAIPLPILMALVSRAPR